MVSGTPYLVVKRDSTSTLSVKSALMVIASFKLRGALGSTMSAKMSLTLGVRGSTWRA